ncbi:SusC/RagA family TonB-linked outer membrane protein [Marinifilum caeruleilacunae]|uniref:TonB-dependent receptor n=1 Tax=Marinifilum caeruleilacunae TaxID=2499076 RepID=A0ABX1WRL7_9BACT|nr:TonB-dependent receptor [Marinifilum caeruleilacunae]NOU58713.1 TonB-dependent receptor [Marinifilum caeruleilacunae]
MNKKTKTASNFGLIRQLLKCKLLLLFLLYSFTGLGTNFKSQPRFSAPLQKASAKEVYQTITEQSKLQKRTISGKVSDSNGTPLPGVTVIVKGTTNGVITNIDGAYELQVAPSAKLLHFSFIGMKAQDIEISGRSAIDVVMEEETIGLQEVVAIGYGKLSRRKVLGAVSSIKSEDISQLPVASVNEALSGRTAGVQVITSGAPGSASRIQVRGVGSITAGRSPLVVVDGYPLTEGSDLSAVNPQDIESISLLKDAASTAIYGSRGANGVLMVTTKTAKSEKVTFNFEGYYGFQNVLNPMELINAYEFAQLTKEARDWGYVSDDPSKRFATDDRATRELKGASSRQIMPANVSKYLDGTPGLTDNNWLDDLFRDGKIESYNLSVSGRNGNTKWMVSGGYFNQEGIILGSDYKRYTTKINLQTKLHEKIKFGINLAPSLSYQNAIIDGWTDSPLQQAFLMEPYFTPYNDKGELNISQQIRWHNNEGTGGALAENPIAIALQKKDEKNKFRLFGSTFIEVEIIEGLTFKTLLGGDFDYTLREQFRPSTIGKYRKDVDAVDPWAKEQTKVRQNILTENTLTYTKSFDKHNLNALAGYSYQKENKKYITVDAPVLDNNYITNVAGSATTKSKKEYYDWYLISYFGRIQYDYDSKYLLSVSARRDGSSRFGDDTKFGSFPSLSAGWVVSNEDFFPKDLSINNLKLRYSWGKTGNNQISDYGAIATLKASNAYLDGKLAPGQIPDTSPNSGLSWETSVTNNWGFDLGLFNNKLLLQTDYFIAKTKDMLLKLPVLDQSGFSSSRQNVGKMENKGLEFVLSANNIKLGKVKWTSSINFSKVKNKVTALGPGQTQIPGGDTNLTQIGREIGEFYGYVVDGIYKSQAEIDASAQKGSTVKVGDWRIVDVSGNGTVGEEDRKVIGSSLPDFTYGFNNRFSYKNFDLNVFIDGVYGIDVLDKTVRNATNGQGFSNQLKWYYKNRWHPQNNPNGTLARPDATQSSERLRANVSTAFLQDGSFMRIRNITLGYNLPKSLCSKIGADKLRLYVTAKNPVMFTDFKGFNPEQATSNALNPSNTQGAYPQNKSFVFGVNLSF